MLRRTGFKPKGWQPREAKQVDYDPRPRAPAVASALINPREPVPKRNYWRSPAYRAMAQDKPCMLAVPGVCCRDWSTTVLAHSNRGADGKGGAIKACDSRAVWACAACHAWLDQGPAPAAQKEAAWEAACVRQVAALEGIAQGSGKEAELSAEALRRIRAPAP